MMGLFFLVVCAVGILRPIKNALALDGLGDTDFYKVYLVSAAVVVFVPVYNRLADRVPWRWLIPAVAFSFALQLVLFRIFYVEGSTAFGMLFYGWYDLFAAALVTQFFMATQLFFNARSAKQAYPLVIAGGSVGATLGGGITGFFSQRVGTPNLLLVAAGLIVVFSVALPIVWGNQPPGREAKREEPRRQAGELRALWRNRQVRLIALSVLITILVKQIVDYEFNTITKEVFQDRDAISAFQGKFNVVTQWLPIVALALLQPVLRRWGVGVAVMILPTAMLLALLGLEIWWGLWLAVIAKGADTSLRYSTERAAREILYVPVPEEIKLKAKAYIDVALEKGVGKATSAGVIALLLLFMPYRQIALVGAGLAALWLVLSLSVRHEYVRTLARSIEGRFASLRGGFASLEEASTREAVRRVLRSDEPLQVAFGLDLLTQGSPQDVRDFQPELNALLEHPNEAVRVRVLQLLQRTPERADLTRVRPHLTDGAAAVREAAVEVLLAAGESAADLSARLEHEDTRARTTALAAVSSGSADAVDLIKRLAGSADPAIAVAGLQAAALLRADALLPTLLHALGTAGTRAAARSALAAYGEDIIDLLAERLLSRDTPERVRHQIPSVLARIPAQRSIDVLIRSYLAPETDQRLDYFTLKALGRLRARHPELAFPRSAVVEAVGRETAALRNYDRARAALAAIPNGQPVTELLVRTLNEARLERIETIFRWLGLVFPPDAMRDCHQTLMIGGPRTRANAVEWLETTIGHDLFVAIRAALLEIPENGRSGQDAIAVLRDDNDAWVAELVAALGTNRNDGSMDLVEKVLLLQRVDLLQGARSAHLALLASIARVQDVTPGTTLIKQDEPTRAMYVVIRGAVELRDGNHLLSARDGTAFGTWALIDQAPSLMSAEVVESSRLLCIERDDFVDLLNENPELSLGLLQGLARRVRTLVS